MRADYLAPREGGRKKPDTIATITLMRMMMLLTSLRGSLLALTFVVHYDYSAGEEYSYYVGLFLLSTESWRNETVPARVRTVKIFPVIASRFCDSELSFSMVQLLHKYH